MRSGYLDKKYINMNEAGVKEDYFYVMEYAAVLHDVTSAIFFAGCVKSKWSNKISKYSQKNIRQWLEFIDISGGRCWLAISG